MRNVFGVVAVAAVCGACCAFPVALPALGSVASSLALALGLQEASLAGVVVLTAMAVFVWWRTRRRASPARPGGKFQPDGPRVQMSEPEAQHDMPEPPACALPSPQMLERISAIAGVARRGLLAHQQCGPALYLRYSTTVAHELERLVALEQEGAPFLDFELAHRQDAVHLIITAPAAAAQFASTLTSHFLGKPPTQLRCGPSCGCNPGAAARRT
jgi:hypothetical protein